ncbi:rhodanese-like domain-containing protein [Desulfovibrio aminophilus]|nr:rhodanese-like domain-containing protein [Desulfovibrio aminophilus]MCM0756755.1 rhodanese-like domain-containing protein [Desulfovibrio aminophilus]
MAKRRLTFLLSFLILLLSVGQILAAPAPNDKRKETVLQKYLDAKEAYAMWQASPDKVFIVDVRTPEEYDFVGHPAMARNVPVQTWAGKWDTEKKSMPLVDNPAFVSTMKKLHKPGDTLILMCRSGHRSAKAIAKLAEAGFTNVYNMIDGFEGDKVEDKANSEFGKRVLNGWRNSKLPWTYALDEKLIYMPVN